MKLNRRKALKIFGAIFVCLAGRGVAGANNDYLSFSDFTPPTDYTFFEEGMGDIIIGKKDGKKLIVPFSDIIKALEETDEK